MSALTVTLGADITALKRAMTAAGDLVASSARRMKRLTGAGLAGLGRGGAVALQKGFALTGTALKASIGGVLAGGAAAMAGGVKAVNAAADFEQTKVAFSTLIGDAAKAEETLARLRKLGAETPFEFPELADAGRKLIAFGEGADTVPDTLRRIGDISAGIQAPVNQIAELYGKARVQGRLFAEDINQLTGRGIPIIQELAKQFGVSDSEVKKLVSSGQVGFPAIEQAFISLTSEGGKFFGLDLDGMEQFGDKLTGEAAAGLADRIAAAAAQAIADSSDKGEFIDTTEMQDKLVGIVQTIKAALPKPGDAKNAADAATKAATPGAQSPLSTTSQRIGPVVTSLGKVGGGGYTSGALDAQRENNRLTGETNSLLRESNKHLSKLRNRNGLTASFG